MELSPEFETWLKEKIADRLVDYEGVSTYGADLAYTLFEGENADCCVHPWTEAEKNFIKEYWDDAGEVHAYLKDNLDMVVNPFDEPHKFAVCMLLEGAAQLISESEFVNKHWNEEMELGEIEIAAIKEDLGIHREEEKTNPSLTAENLDAKYASLELSANRQNQVGGRSL